MELFAEFSTSTVTSPWPLEVGALTTCARSALPLTAPVAVTIPGVDISPEASSVTDPFSTSLGATDDATGMWLAERPEVVWTMPAGQRDFQKSPVEAKTGRLLAPLLLGGNMGWFENELRESERKRRLTERQFVGFPEFIIEQTIDQACACCQHRQLTVRRRGLSFATADRSRLSGAVPIESLAAVG